MANKELKVGSVVSAYAGGYWLITDKSGDLVKLKKLYHKNGKRAKGDIFDECHICYCDSALDVLSKQIEDTKRMFKDLCDLEEKILNGEIS